MVVQLKYVAVGCWRCVEVRLRLAVGGWRWPAGGWRMERGRGGDRAMVGGGVRL